MRSAYALMALAIGFSLVADTPLRTARANGGDQDKDAEQTQPLHQEGSVWSLVFVKTKPGEGKEYLESLTTGWKPLMEEMKKANLILSYKVFRGSAANKDDWDVMLLVEYPNMAALDNLEAKVHKLLVKTHGTEDKVKQGYRHRNDVREVLGEKVVRELILK